MTVKKKTNLSKKQILYLSYDGILEPLGESQALKYLLHISQNHIVTLYSFEKPEDLEKAGEFNRIQNICSKNQIDWVINKYHRKPKVPATFFDIWQGVWKSVKIIKKKKIDLIHARGHIPSIMAFWIKRWTGTPFIFDMRGFWPEEMSNAKRISAESLVYRGLKQIEFSCLTSCDHLVILTHAAADYLNKKPGLEGIMDKTSVIPTCVDINQFRLNVDSNVNKKKYLHLGIVGTITGWVDLERMLIFFYILKRIVPQAKISIITRDSPKKVYKLTKSLDIDSSGITIKEVTFQKVAKEIKLMDAGIFFYKPHLSELARSPTKMSEFLASGIPCIANEGIGDVSGIIEKYKVGVVIKDAKPPNYTKAVHELLSLLKDDQLSKRCRKAAEEVFSLDRGVKKYMEIYKQLTV